MNTDIRILTNFKGHRKRKRLKLILGHDGAGYLIDLWLSVATDASSGILTGWDEFDIAIAAGWDDHPSIFTQALIDAGFLEKDGSGTYVIHDWVKNNGWAAGAEARSEKARNAAIKKWEKARKGEKSNAQGAKSCSEQCSEHNESSTEHARSNAPSPSPFPSPNPKDLNKSNLEGGVGETKTPQEPPVDKSSKEPFSKQDESKPLKDLFSKVLNQWPASRDCNWNLFFQLQNRCRPDVMTHALESLLKHGDLVDNPIAYCTRVIQQENMNYNERDHIAESANRRASRTEAAQAMAHIGEILNMLGRNEAHV